MPEALNLNEDCRVMVIGPKQSGKTTMLELLPLSIRQNSLDAMTPEPLVEIDDCEQYVVEQEKTKLGNKVKFEQFRVNDLVARGFRRLENPTDPQATSEYFSHCFRLRAKRLPNRPHRNVILIDHPGGDFVHRPGEEPDLSDTNKENRTVALTLAEQCETLIICYPLGQSKEDHLGRGYLKALPYDTDQLLRKDGTKLRKVIVAFTKAEYKPYFHELLSRNQVNKLLSKVKSEREVTEFLKGLRNNCLQKELAITALSSIGTISKEGSYRESNLRLAKSLRLEYQTQMANSITAYDGRKLDVLALSWQAINLWQTFYYAAFGRAIEGSVELLDG